MSTTIHSRKLSCIFALCLAAAAPYAAAQTAGRDARTGTGIEFAAEASRTVNNDLFRALVSAEASGATPGELARQVNAQIADAFKMARAFASIKAQSAGTSTSPVYGKSNKIESWRMRTELMLETSDSAALSELLGRLQGTLAVSALTMQPSPETRRRIENEVTVDAIAAFKARADVIAGAMGKKYRITQMNIHTNSRGPQPLYRAANKSMLMEAASAPMPVEGGESAINATVTGQIELESAQP